MSSPTDEPSKQGQLRADAEDRLKEGAAPRTSGWIVSADTLALLYNLARDPASSGDALKLLHELQVHQVELDLQHAQLVAQDLEMTHDLDRYKALYEFAPTGYFVVDLNGQIIEANRAGPRLLGVTRDALGGRPLDGFLTPKSRPVLGGLMNTLREGSSVASCEVHSGNGVSVPRLLRIIACLSPGGEAILMVVSEHERPPEA